MDDISNGVIFNDLEWPLTGLKCHDIFRGRQSQKQQVSGKKWITIDTDLLNGSTLDDLEWPLSPVHKVTRGSSVYNYIAKDVTQFDWPDYLTSRRAGLSASAKLLVSSCVKRCESAQRTDTSNRSGSECSLVFSLTSPKISRTKISLSHEIWLSFQNVTKEKNASSMSSSAYTVANTIGLIYGAY